MKKLTIDFFIHDSEILNVSEDTLNDTLEFTVDYPIDFDNNIFEHRILRFYNFLNYTIKEIPLASRPQILDFNDLGEINYSIGEGRNKINIKRRKLELLTNAGKRTLEYENLELISKE
ncbi:hypothetical protein DWB61_17365 [Ancylomarina euxinus]|uniref:Uncharacterized protein n=1 Tax=Ancylomarina euxinus TaxID=2283627 RepID=A0A425XWG6_9BACT|nr:hypothetical protein [Ancylomarina euxinus]MCZ4696418.1 hypothetical protein [Ancylomarina euxinus]MUP15644.1 hypothetical protein [Ancylomarina euxinus]RRG18986.1 hypothetical protein DWB61_17365 [Ancylomarina euxinus]